MSSASQSSLVAAEQLLSTYSQKPSAASTSPLEVASTAMTPESTTIVNRSKRPSIYQKKRFKPEDMKRIVDVFEKRGDHPVDVSYLSKLIDELELKEEGEE